MTRKIGFFLASLFLTSCLITTLPIENAYADKPAGIKNSKTNTKNKKNDENATELLEKMALAIKNQQFASALSFCEKAHTLNPNNIEILETCAVLAQEAKQDEKTILFANKIQVLTPNQNNYSVCLLKATGYTKLHRWSEAIETYAQCSPKSPEEKALSLGNIAELYMVQGDLTNAIKSYQESLRTLESNPHAIFGYVIALKRSGDEAKARQSFFWGLSQHPTLDFLNDAFFEPEGELFFHRAVFADYLGQKNDAIANLNAYIKTKQRKEYIDFAKQMLSELTTKPTPRLDTFPLPEPFPLSIAIDTQHHYLALGTKTGRLTLLDRNTLTVHDYPHSEQPIRDLNFNPDGHILRAISANKLHEMQMNDQSHTLYSFPILDSRFALNFNATGEQILFLDSNETIRMVNIDNYDENIAIHSNTAEQKPEKSELLNFSLLNPNHDITSFEERENLMFNPRSITRYPVNAAIFGDNTRFFTSHLSAYDENSVIIDRTTKKVQGVLPKFLPYAVKAHPTHHYFVVATHAGAFFVNPDGEILFVLSGINRTGMSALGFDPTGRFLATAGENNVEIWDLNEISFPDSPSKANLW